MRFLSRWLVAFTSWVAVGGGGSASETPFPEEPLPDHVTAKAAASNAAPAKPEAAAGKPDAKATPEANAQLGVKLGSGAKKSGAAAGSAPTSEAPAGKPASSPAF